RPAGIEGVGEDDPPRARQGRDQLDPIRIVDVGDRHLLTRRRAALRGSRWGLTGGARLDDDPVREAGRRGMGGGGGGLSGGGDRLRGVAYGSRGVDDAGPWKRGGVFVDRDGPIPIDTPDARIPVERQWRLGASRRDDVAHGG